MIKRLPADLEAFVQQEVASGKYQSEDEFVAEAVRLLNERATQREASLQTHGETPYTPASQTANDILCAIARALETGEFVLARRLATEGAEQFPQHPELGRYAHVLAPPTVSRSTRPPNPAIKSNQAWLKAHWQEYPGHWVALRDGQLVYASPSFEQLAAHVGNTTGIFLTKIHACL